MNGGDRVSGQHVVEHLLYLQKDADELFHLADSSKSDHYEDSRRGPVASARLQADGPLLRKEDGERGQTGAGRELRPHEGADRGRRIGLRADVDYPAADGRNRAPKSWIPDQRHPLSSSGRRSSPDSRPIARVSGQRTESGSGPGDATVWLQRALLSLSWIMGKRGRILFRPVPRRCRGGSRLVENEELAEKYRVDPKRISLVGHSMGAGRMTSLKFLGHIEP